MPESTQAASVAYSENTNRKDGETLTEEFARLVKEYYTGEGSEKAEAWNLIADFAVENNLKICLALERTFPK